MMLIMTTLPDQASAERLATCLVEQNLAACVNMIPGIQSVYRWKDAIQKDHECLLLIKTQAQRYADLESVVLEQHPYDLPEIIAVPVEQGLAGYLAWVRASCQ